MEGNDGAESSSGPKLSIGIADIFKNIQQKLARTQTEESGDGVFSANSSQSPEPRDNMLDTSAPVPEQSNSTPATPLSELESDNHRSCSKFSVASVPVCKPCNNNTTIETSVSVSDLNSGSVAVSAPALNQCSGYSVSVAPSPEASKEDAVNGQHEADSESDVSDQSKQSQRWGEPVKERNICSESSGMYASELQTTGPAGTADQATAENETSQRRHDEINMCETSTALTHTTPGSQTSSNSIVIKQEKEDVGYELFRHGSTAGCEEDMAVELVRMKKEVFGIKSERQDFNTDAEVGNDEEVRFCGISYRDPGDTDSESDNDTSSLTSFGVDVEEPEPENARMIPRTTGEVLPEELPPLENLHISLPEETRLEQLGVVSGIVGVLVVIESTVDLRMYSPLNDDTVLFYENREPFGVVFEVFGPCKAPSYSVRFNSADDIKEKGIKIGFKVYFVPDPVPEVGEITHYVFVHRLRQNKGSDASWKGNNEPPENCVDFSDDEEERRSKKKRKAGNAKGGTTDPKRRVTDDEKKGKKGPGKKKQVSFGHEGASLGSVPGRADTTGAARYPEFGSGQHSQQSSSFRQGRGNFRRGFCLSKPVFTGPTNPVRDPPCQLSSWGPPPPPSPNSPQTFHPRSGPSENMWVRGPYSGSPGNGPSSGMHMGPSFSDVPGSGHSAGASGRAPFSDDPESGSFEDGPRTAPFLNSPGNRPFASGSVGSAFSHSLWTPSHAGSVFPIDTSVPPPETCSFSPGQVNSQQGHPPPPPLWTPGPSPSFSMGSVDPSTSLSACSSSNQPHRFSQSPGQFGPPQLGFGAVGQPLARFQGQPQFAQYHQHQSWQQ